MQVKHLTKIIQQQLIFEDVSFSLPQGEIVGLVGRNGTGKTTLLRTLASQYVPDSGEILIQGSNILESPMFKEEIFYIDEKANFFASYTLDQLHQFYAAVYPQFDITLYHELMMKHQLHETMRFKSISKGMQGLFKMILAIASNATYLLLDEPFDGLDIIVRKEVIALLVGYIGQTGHTALIASHDLSELDHLADRVFFLKGTQLSLGYELEKIKEKSRKIQIVFRQPAIPEFIKQHTTILSIQGRVVIVFIDDYTPEVMMELKQLDPILVEELPLSLEDLFIAKLTSERKGEMK